MIWKYTVKQLFRTPGKLLLFFLLLVLSAALLVSGFNLWANTGKALSQMSQAYTTRGTVRQLPDSTELRTFTNAYGTTTYENPLYTKVVELEDFSSLPYLLPPENRPVLYTKGIREKNGKEILTYPNTSENAVVRFRVQEDFNNLSGVTTGQPGESTASGSDQMTLSSLSVLQADGSFTEYSLPGCQLCLPHSTDSSFTYDFRTSEEYLAFARLDIRATPIVTLTGCGFAASATEYETEYSSLPELYYPYADGFFSTEEGKAFLNYAKNQELFGRNAFPTVPTNDNMLLEPFFKKWITMKYGRAITPEEYASGARVCMVPEYLASDPSDSDTNPTGYNNNMSVGDKLTLSFYGAAYSQPPINSSYDPKQSLNAVLFPNKVLEPFSTETYEIVGVYRQQVPPDTDDMAMFGYLQVIVPEKSIEGGVSNIVLGGPLAPENVSFLLENGTADSFLLNFDQLGYDNLQVEVDDMGYAEVARGVAAVTLVARILFFAGLAGVLCVLVFFVYLQIVRREKETAVQISLGSGRRRAAASLLLAVMLVAVPGAAGGAVLGHAVSGSISRQVYDSASQSAYSREYSDLYASENREQVTLQMEADPVNTLAAGAGIAFCALLLTGFFTARSLRREPIELLSKGEDGT